MDAIAAGDNSVVFNDGTNQLVSENPREFLVRATGGVPGSLVEMKISEDSTRVSDTVKVPVLDATLKEYKEYLPTGSEPSESASPSASRCFASKEAPTALIARTW